MRALTLVALLAAAAYGQNLLLDGDFTFANCVSFYPSIHLRVRDDVTTLQFSYEFLAGGSYPNAFNTTCGGPITASTEVEFVLAGFWSVYDTENNAMPAGFVSASGDDAFSLNYISEIYTANVTFDSKVYIPNNAFNGVGDNYFACNDETFNLVDLNDLVDNTYNGLCLVSFDQDQFLFFDNTDLALCAGGENAIYLQFYGGPNSRMARIALPSGDNVDPFVCGENVVFELDSQERTNWLLEDGSHDVNQVIPSSIQFLVQIIDQLISVYLPLLIELEDSDLEIVLPPIVIPSITFPNLNFTALNITDLTLNQILTGDVSLGHLSLGNLDTGNLDTGDLTLGALEAGDVSLGALEAGDVSLGALAAGDVSLGALTAEDVSLGALTAEDVSLGALTAEDVSLGDVSLGALTAGDVSLGALTAEDVSLGALTAEDVSLGALTAEDVSLGDVSLGALAAEDVSLGDVSLGALAAGDVSLGDVSAENVTLGALTIGPILSENFTTGDIRLGKIELGDIDVGGLTYDGRDVSDIARSLFAKLSPLFIAGYVMLMIGSVSSFFTLLLTCVMFRRAMYFARNPRRFGLN